MSNDRRVNEKIDKTPLFDKICHSIYKGNNFPIFQNEKRSNKIDAKVSALSRKGKKTSEKILLVFLSFLLSIVKIDISLHSFDYKLYIFFN